MNLPKHDIFSAASYKFTNIYRIYNTIISIFNNKNKRFAKVF